MYRLQATIKQIEKVVVGKIKSQHARAFLGPILLGNAGRIKLS